MELILRLYLLPYDPDYPVVCFDERPCFLIGDTIEPIPMKKGQPLKENHSYSKHGSCSVLASIEPLTGKRVAHIREKRRKKEFAEFMMALAKAYPEAIKIKVVLDNLNTHDFSAFYEVYEAEKADWLMNRFEFIFTPKSASWLNMIEIEFSALSRLCLNRRIPCMKELESEVLAFFKERTQKGVKIIWQFTKEKARETLNRHYIKVNSKNSKYKKT